MGLGSKHPSSTPPRGDSEKSSNIRRFCRTSMMPGREKGGRYNGDLHACMHDI